MDRQVIPTMNPLPGVVTIPAFSNRWMVHAEDV